MTDDAHFILAVHTVVAVAEAHAARHQLSDEDATALACAAAIEFVAGRIGRAAAVERFRDTADVAERELLAAG